MENPLVGGYTPEKVALRRAMVLGNDVDREIRIARHGQAIPAQTIVPPMLEGYRRDLRTAMSEYDPARAKALLDLYGYVDRDGDGWRELPDGGPLVLEMATQSDQVSRQLDELWKKDMDALGLRVVLKTAQWPENLKSARAGKFMIWRVGSLAVDARRPERARARLRPVGRQGQHRAISPCRVRRGLRRAEARAERARSGRRCSTDGRR